MPKVVAGKSGIYMIVNLVTDRRYVGSTSVQTISARFAQHRYSLRKGKHGNYALQRSWDVHGEQAFAFVPLENCDNNTLEREQYWVDKFREQKGVYVYNFTEPINGGNGGFSGTPHSEKSKRKMSRSQKKRQERMTADERKEYVRPIREYWDNRTREELGSAVKRGYYERNMANDPVYLVSPSGDIVEVHNRYIFSLEHDLDPSAITKVIKGKRLSHKGWTLAD